MSTQKRLTRSGNKFLIVCGGSGAGLLGQRRILGVRGELQIDARGELLKSDHDPFSSQIAVDFPAPAVNMLMAELERNIERVERFGGNVPDEVIRNPSYNYLLHPASQKHGRYLIENLRADVNLTWGLAQSPPVGGVAIRHRDNVLALESATREISQRWASNPGADNPFQFWFISSTAGGTGEGVHRFVAETIVRVLETGAGAPVQLNFIRIGAGTYHFAWDRTALNTFFGVAADVAFAHRLGRDYSDVALSTNWFYLDLPDVGRGDAAKPIRKRLIETTSKAIMLDELVEPLNALLVNDGAVVVRAGFWSRDFSEDIMYLETLRSLIGRLNHLIEPPYDEFTEEGKPPPSFAPGEAFQDIRRRLGQKRYLLNRIESGWSFPRVSAVNTPQQLAQAVAAWIEAIGDLLGLEIRSLEPRPHYEIEETIWKDDAQQTRMALFDVAGKVTPGQEWFDDISDAHRAKAWCASLLGLREDGWRRDRLIAELVNAASACQSAVHGFDPFAGGDRRAERLAQNLPLFVERLVQVNYLLDLHDRAERLLNVELEGAKQVREFVKERHRAVEATVERSEASPIIAAKLSDRLDRLEGRDWLRMLERAVEREDEVQFKRDVMRGAIGLTEAGLKSVLELPITADDEDIHKELISRMGKMYDSDGDEFDAQWWTSAEPPAHQAHYNYRILPQLEPGFAYRLGDGDSDSASYLYAGLGVLGLNVMAFEGVSIAPFGDTVTTPRYLLRRFVSLVRQALDHWDMAIHGDVTGKDRIAMAGVVGDPLYAEALLEAGLTEEDLEKLAEFYILV